MKQRIILTEDITYDMSNEHRKVSNI